MGEVVESTLRVGRRGLALEAEGREVRTGRSDLSTSKADTCAVVREVDAQARGKGPVTGFIAKSRKVVLGLSMRDDVQ